MSISAYILVPRYALCLCVGVVWCEMLWRVCVWYGVCVGQVTEHLHVRACPKQQNLAMSVFFDYSSPF